MFGYEICLRRIGYAFAVVVVIAVTVYGVFFFDGIPVIWGPSASASDIAAGRELFEHEWTPNDPLAHGDGLGPVYNARSCAACHFQGGLGGGGELAHNAVAFEILPRPDAPKFLKGSLHGFSVDPNHQESLALLKTHFPTIKGTKSEFDPVRTDSLQATALFGAGWIDLISERAIVQQRRKRLARGIAREMNLEFSEIPVGRLNELGDGRIGRFGWRAQFATLQEFVAAACANEIGLGTPDVEQAKPLSAPGMSASPDLDKKQFRQLVAFVKTLPRPQEIAPTDANERATAANGKKLFAKINCAACHVPDMGGVKGLYSDFLLYSLDDPLPAGGGRGSYGGEPPPEFQLPPRPDREPKPEEWRTPPLWGVADSAPYLHDGSAKTLEDAIARHRGDARPASEAYNKLSSHDQAAVIAFLKTLKAPANAIPLADSSITKLK